MSGAPLLCNVTPAPLKRAPLSDPVQAACSTSGRLCNSVVGLASSKQLHRSALSGRPLGSTVCRRQGRAVTLITALYKPYPYNQKDYFPVDLLLLAEEAEYSGGRGVGAAVLARLDEYGERTDREYSLILQIGGDSLAALQSIHENFPVQRPLALNLLWKVLQRGQDISNRDWKLLRVAIVDMRNNTYVARLFFGNQETGEVAWDCDCRPSDGLWLSKQAKCPMYVHKSVWFENKSYTRTVIQGNDETAHFLIGSAAEAEDLSGTNALTTVREADPEPVKRLKREMAVALSEEDYVSAARIRDHPFMKLAVQIIQEKLAGRDSEAEALQAELEKVVQAQQ
ncbi:hypothetical protein ABBQ38_013807 [Trebouxia sp. C0009 RCD-2024]